MSHSNVYLDVSILLPARIELPFFIHFLIERFFYIFHQYNILYLLLFSIYIMFTYPKKYRYSKFT